MAGKPWKAASDSLAGLRKKESSSCVKIQPKPPSARLAKARRGKDRQALLPQAKAKGWDACATPWSGKISVLVTSLDIVAFPTQIMPKHYHDRGDAENCFDELKNQWG